MLKAIIKVDGMMCPMCEAHANDAIHKTMPKCRVSASHKLGKVVVIDKEINAEVLRSAIENTGYRVLDIAVENYEKKSLFARLFKK